MIIQIGNNPACLTPEGQIRDYVPETDRAELLLFLLSKGQIFVEDLIWPDMPVIRAESREVLRQYLEYDRSEFINQTTESERAAYAYAKMQLEPSDLSTSLDEVLDDLIASGKIQFATEEDLKASVVPENQMSEEDSRLPKQIALRAEREKQRLALEAEASAEFSGITQ